MSDIDIIKAAIEKTRSEYSANGNHDSEVISDALRNLLENIEEIEHKQRHT